MLFPSEKLQIFAGRTFWNKDVKCKLLSKVRPVELREHKEFCVYFDIVVTLLKIPS
jgi:hypothetical protein